MTFNLLFQVRRFSRFCQAKNPLDALSNMLKRAGSLCHTFTSWQHKAQRNCTHSDNSVIEDDHFNPPVKMEKIGNISGVQTCSLHAPPQCEKPTEIDNLCYEAESPDEAALVYAAKAYGFILLARTPNSVTVRLPSGEDLVFEVLDTLAFDYNRKRMSVLVRHPITKENVLYIKGADYAIMELLGTPYAGMYVLEKIHLNMFTQCLFCYIHVLVSTEPLWVMSFKMKLFKYFCVMLFSGSISGTQKAIATTTQYHLNSYAKDGLRTLCIAKKVHNQIHKYLPASFSNKMTALFHFFSACATGCEWQRVCQLVSEQTESSGCYRKQRGAHNGNCCTARNKPVTSR